MITIPCGCEYDEADETIYWNGGMGPGEGCREHAPPTEPLPNGWQVAVLNGKGEPIDTGGTRG